MLSEQSNKLLAILCHVDADLELSNYDDALIIPAVIGVICFLPGLLLGQIISQKAAWILIAAILLLSALVGAYYAINSGKREKIFVTKALNEGFSVSEADDFLKLWSDLKSRQRKRAIKSLKKDK